MYHLTLQQPRKQITATKLDPRVRTNLAATGSDDGELKLWKIAADFKSISLVFTYEVTGFINDVRFSVDGSLLAIAAGQEHREGRWWYNFAPNFTENQTQGENHYILQAVVCTKNSPENGTAEIQITHRGSPGALKPCHFSSFPSAEYGIIKIIRKE
ncbi:hypothetical protein ANCDUO_05989 [Ancylostoma duodenale]|uniref:WD domain, G-beta repeat protein n=1 Tax=Ancylostoma duodenale TaxID=51022 RepID=A0A0C2GXB0_9BILA|nr:hypothetical protein ANCDUO_05989 [Ancylostoma duodenale]